MTDPNVDALFENLIKESKAYKEAKSLSKSTQKGWIKTENGWSKGARAKANPGPTASIDKLKLLHEKRVADFESMRTGLLPGGWEVEGLLMQVVKYQCEYCLSTTEAVSPAVVYLVIRQTRHKETKYMRPLRSGEINYYLRVDEKLLYVERNEVLLPICQHCHGDLRG